LTCNLEAPRQSSALGGSPLLYTNNAIRLKFLYFSREMLSSVIEATVASYVFVDLRCETNLWLLAVRRDCGESKRPNLIPVGEHRTIDVVVGRADIRRGLVLLERRFYLRSWGYFQTNFSVTNSGSGCCGFS
jgi:hypothetical protein